MEKMASALHKYDQKVIKCKHIPRHVADSLDDSYVKLNVYFRGIVKPSLIRGVMLLHIQLNHLTKLRR